MRRLLLGLLLCATCVQAKEPAVRIGMIASIPPYVYAQQDKGIEVDLIREALRRTGRDAEMIYTPLERVIYGFKAGQIDAAATMDESSGLKAVYSAPYIEFHHVAVALEKNQLAIKQVADLGQYRMVSFRRASNFLGPAFAAAAKAAPEYHEENNDIDLNRLLYKGAVDVVVGDERIFRAIMAQLPESADNPVRVYRVFPAKPYSVAFRDAKLRGEFDKAMAQMRADGSYARIVAHYLDLLPTMTEQ
ncbi:amino acid ABC transporter substrate-binding protein, PAAT family [Andreprevotia lacus DSM 23236]|jgi:polar amino acid transport system substrate-binding protein|uniref:Amino acid ABC transporter substrate-binding protein, PAAT family n=1 Tax=Andreprevotia lacus DSM 23236 TaxID=1121001 RepID=A0A1W1XMD7_9NEIS|nr:transporter substrate-binding domain-containing protein [Andreprevotia lacus]SMC25086.1 amino acid ABC transporter substrate-binding protein, PAAT family [Andreprevotia lacus DSM 23236]